MFTWIHDQLGDMLWPALGLLAGVLLIRALIALGVEFHKRLFPVMVFGALICAATAETTVAPADVTSPLGEWGQDSSILSEVKLARDESRLTNCLLALIIGGQWASIALRNVRP